MQSYPSPTKNTRLGFHYYQDTVHYREADLQTWIPELHSMGVSWLILKAPSDRAIPESFLTGLISAGIEPILHFCLSLDDLPTMVDLSTLLASYQKWGIHYVTFFDRPNSRAAWSLSAWAQEDLVERFLDRFTPLARSAAQLGLFPVFPPLEPAGDYWDTAFLETALTSLLRRNETDLLERLVLSAYAWTWEQSLNWGAGGPERWPGARPYFTPVIEEDQRGFRIFEWYLAIARAVLHRSPGIFLFGAGNAYDQEDFMLSTGNPVMQATTNLTIVRLVSDETFTDPDRPEMTLEPVSSNVLSANLWLLTATATDPHLKQAWFQPDGQTLPVVGALRQYQASRQVSEPKLEQKTLRKTPHPISHYLLLPSYEWGVSDWHLDAIRPFIKKYRPTIGFSIQEAYNADRVTVIGNENSFSDNDISSLRTAGINVERISGDGTQIATILAER